MAVSVNSRPSLSYGQNIRAIRITATRFDMEERKVIFTITSLYVKKIREGGKEEKRRPCEGRTSLVGWYSDLATAQKCVEEDWADFDEGLYYNYIVIEKNHEGLYNMDVDLDEQYEWWYSFDYKQEKWIACGSVGVINCGLG